jgi:uncharacterized RDD family membrane protein YckC
VTKIHSEVLEEEFKAFEESIEAPVSITRSDADKPASAANLNVVAMRIASREVTIPSVMRRLCSTVFDFVHYLIFAFLTFGLHLWTSNPVLADTALSNPFSIELAGQITLGSTFAIHLILWMVLYPIFTFGFIGETPGFKVSGIELICENGEELKWYHLVCRSLLMPVSLLFFGYLPVLIRKRTLHDALARTMVIIEDSENTIFEEEDEEEEKFTDTNSSEDLIEDSEFN